MTAHIVQWQDVLDRMPSERREATINRLADRLIDGSVKPNIYYLDASPSCFGFQNGDYVAPPTDCA